MADRTRSIRGRLLREQVLLILLLGGALMATTFFGARRAVEGLSSSIMRRAADAAEAELHGFFDPVASALAAIRAWGKAGRLPEDDPEALGELLLPVVEQAPQISGLLVAGAESEQFLVRRDGAWQSRLTRIDDAGVRSEWRDGAPASSSGESEGAYDPRTRPWYGGALERSGTLFWTEPYLFFTQQLQGMTAAVAFRLPDGRQRVAAVDVSLADLSRHVRGTEISARGSLWVLTADRRLLAWPDDPELWGDRDPSTALLESPRDLGLPLVDDAVRRLTGLGIEDLETPRRFSSGGSDWWTAGRGFELDGERNLLIAVTVPHADLLGDRARLRWWIAALTAAALLAALARAATLARRFSRPIEALVRESDRISRGDLEAGRPVVSALTEVQHLAEAQRRMRRGLRTLLKLENDLQLARQIQQKTFPRELPRLAGFDLFAWSRPADETGGDSYDVIGLDAAGSITDGEAQSVVLMLADATGHGIGPALSVTQLRAMLRMAVRTGSGLGEMAAHMNEQLYADLPGNRFITAWLGLLQGDGTLATFAGGQAPLLHYRAASDEVAVLGSDAPPFGLLPPMPVVLPPPTRLLPGDVYAVLSDGFFEAKDPSGAEFETHRASEILRRHRRARAEEILAALRAAVRDFTGDAPPDDDRTAVIVKRTG